MPLFFMYSKATHTREIESSTLPPSMLSHCLHHKTAWLSFFLRFFFDFSFLFPTNSGKRSMSSSDENDSRWFFHFSSILPFPLFLSFTRFRLHCDGLCSASNSQLGLWVFNYCSLAYKFIFFSLYVFRMFPFFRFWFSYLFFLGSFFILFFISSLIVCWWAGISSSFLVTFSDYASRHLSWLACSGVFYRGDFLISK